MYLLGIIWHAVISWLTLGFCVGGKNILKAYAEAERNILHEKEQKIEDDISVYKERNEFLKQVEDKNISDELRAEIYSCFNEFLEFLGDDKKYIDYHLTRDFYAVACYYAKKGKYFGTTKGIGGSTMFITPQMFFIPSKNKYGPKPTWIEIATFLQWISINVNNVNNEYYICRCKPSSNAIDIYHGRKYVYMWNKTAELNRYWVSETINIAELTRDELRIVYIDEEF